MMDLITESIVDVPFDVTNKIIQSYNQSVDQAIDLPLPTSPIVSSPRSISSQESIDSEMIDQPAITASDVVTSSQSISPSNEHPNNNDEQVLSNELQLTEQSHQPNQQSDNQSNQQAQQSNEQMDTLTTHINHVDHSSPQRQSHANISIISPKPSRPLQDASLLSSEDALQVLRMAVHASGPSPEPLLPTMTAESTPSPATSPSCDQLDDSSSMQQHTAVSMEDDSTMNSTNNSSNDVNSMSTGDAIQQDTDMTASNTKRSFFTTVVKSPAFQQGSAETKLLKFVYRVFHHLTDLYFAVDKDLDGLPEKRARSEKKSSSEPAAGTIEKLQKREQDMNRIPLTVSPGYGELARSGFDKILEYLMYDAPEAARMDETCSFLDIGSGFGKCVVHTAIRTKVRASTGIEFIPVRHQKGQETVHLLNAKFVPGLTDTRDAQDDQIELLLQNLDLKSVSLVEGDITDEKHQHLLYNATHIYMFDVVFSEHSMEQILPIIEQCNFAMFACYHRPSYLEKLGCRGFVLLHKMTMRTTGNQAFTCYFYTKAAPTRRNTRQKDNEVKQISELEREEKKQKMLESQSRAKKRKRKTATFTRKKVHKYPLSSYGPQPVAENDEENADDMEDGTESDEEDVPEPAPKKRGRAAAPKVAKPVMIKRRRKAPVVAEPEESSAEESPEQAPEAPEDDEEGDAVDDHEEEEEEAHDNFESSSVQPPSNPPPSSLNLILSPGQTRSPISELTRAKLTGDDSDDDTNAQSKSTLSSIRQPTNALIAASSAPLRMPVPTVKHIPKTNVPTIPSGSRSTGKMKTKMLPPVQSRSTKSSLSTSSPSSSSQQSKPTPSISSQSSKSPSSSSSVSSFYKDVSAPPPVRRAAQTAAQSISAKSTSKIITKPHPVTPVKSVKPATGTKSVVKSESKSESKSATSSSVRGIPKKQPEDQSPKSVVKTETKSVAPVVQSTEAAAAEAEAHARSSTRSSGTTNAIQASHAAVECATMLAVAQRLIDEYDEEMELEAKQSSESAHPQLAHSSSTPSEFNDGGQHADVTSQTESQTVPVMNKSRATRLKNAAEVKQVLAVRHHYMEPALRIAVGAAADYTIQKGNAPKDGEVLLYHVFGSEMDPDWRLVY